MARTQIQRFIRAGLAALLLAPACAASAVAQADPALVAAAEAEGQVVVYGSPVSLKVIIPGFNEAYPKIKVVSAMGGGWQMYNRFQTEKRTGNILADAIYASEDALIVAQKAGELMEYRPREADNMREHAFPKNRWFSVPNGQLYGPFYNAQAMEGMTLPKDWPDYANPPQEWHELITIADARNSAGTFSVLAAFHQNYGPEKGAEIFKGLAKAGVEMTSNMGVSMTKLQTGERPLTLFGQTGYLGQLLQAGAPVKMVIPTSGVVVQYDALGVVKGAPHPNAAKLFHEYVLSEDGQRRLAGNQQYAMRKGMPSPEGFPDFDKVKVLPVDLDAAVAEKDKLLAWWRSAMGVQ